MPSRNQLKKMADIRLKEAKVLYNNNLYDGACYLAGYVVELALKARICKLLDIMDYPDSGEISKSFKIHNLDILLRLSGLEKIFNNAKLNNPQLHANWSIITTWNEQYRYNPIGTNQKNNTLQVINALEDQTNGIYKWIQKRW